MAASCAVLDGWPTIVPVGAAWRVRSDRHRTIHGDAMHQPPQRQLIVADRQMLGHAVVPHQQVSEAPLMPVAELRPGDHVAELLDERQALLVRHAANPDAFALAHINGFSPGDGVRPYDGMLDVRDVLDEIAQLAAGGVFLGASAVDRAQAQKGGLSCPQASESKAAAALAKTVSPSARPFSIGISRAYSRDPRGGVLV